MSAASLLEEIRREGAAGTFDWQRTRERIHAEHERTTDFAERGNLVRLHAVLFDQVERGVPPEHLEEFRATRWQDYNLLLVREATVDGKVVPQLLDAVTQREVAAGRMADDHELRVLAAQGMAMITPPAPTPPPARGFGGLLGRFRRREPQATPARPASTPATEPTPGEDDLFRAEVARLYELGVNPLEAIHALVSPKAGSTVDIKRLVGVWLGVQDLLDRLDVVNPIRCELVTIEGVLGQSVADASDGARAYVADYRRRTGEIREMQVLQSYATLNAAGNLDLDLVRRMVADLERERATPGSMAQAVSDDKMADLYRLIANWDDPSKLRPDTR